MAKASSAKSSTKNTLLLFLTGSSSAVGDDANLNYFTFYLRFSNSFKHRCGSSPHDEVIKQYIKGRYRHEF